MHFRRSSYVAVVALAAVASSPAWAASPAWNKMAVFKHLEARPNELYPITDDNGPWMIMAATFSGEGAEKQATRLIYELRKDFKLPAYSYQKKFEFSKPVEGKGVNPHGEAPVMRHQRNQDYVEIAVMVGDYPSVDDGEAQKVLKKLKVAQPKALALEEGKSTNQSLVAFRALQREAKQNMFGLNTEEARRGPMGTAFVVANPILPSEYFVPKGVDKFVLDMNKDVPHSLLNCKGSFTVKVATFTGTSIILERKWLEAMERGDLPKSHLEDAAKSAHLLTEALRKKRYDAYEFHARGSSIVTIGSFDSVGSRRPDGKVDLNPAILTIIRTFGAETSVDPSKVAEVGKRKKLAGIPFDVQPVPVEVPKRSIATDYQRTSDLR